MCPLALVLRTIDDACVDAVIAKTLERPKQPRHWSTRTMARAKLIGRRRYRASGAHSTAAPSTGDLQALQRSVAGEVTRHRGLYMDPLKAMVLCVDEKSQIRVP